MYLHGCKQTPATPPTTSDEDSSGSTDDGEMKKKKGNRAMGKKKYPKAVKYYSKAVKIDPENPTYRLNRAIAHASLELWKDAEADAQIAVELGPTAKSYYQLARARLKRGNLDEAHEALEQGLAAYPEEPAMLQLHKDVERHRTAREEKQKKAAAAAAEAAAKASAAEGGGLEGAKALLARARSAYSDSPDEALALSAAARQAAAACSSTEGRREEISACSLQGKVAMRLRKWDEAAEAFGRAVALEEAVYSLDNEAEREALANAYNNLGIALKNGNKLEKAVDALNKAYATSTNSDDQVATPQVAQVVQNLAQVLVQQGKFVDARNMYSRALQVGQRLHGPEHASHALNHMGIARCLTKEGRFPEAVKTYTTAYELWQSKDIETCLAEMPEVPSKERLLQVQEQCRQELTQLVLILEEARRRQEASTGSAEDGADGAAGG